MLTLGWDLLYTVLNIIILLVLLRLFLFKPVLKIIEERERLIKKSYQDIADEKQSLAETKEEALEETKRLQTQVQSIMTAAQERAAISEREIIAKATAEASTIIETANKKAAQEREKMIQGTKEELVDIAMQTAAQILTEKSQEKDEAPSLLNFIDEMEGKS